MPGRGRSRPGVRFRGHGASERRCDARVRLSQLRREGPRGASIEPVAVLGADGQLGSTFAHLLGSRAVKLTRKDLDLTRIDEIPTVLDEVGARLVVNCAAYTDVDAAEREENLATTINGEAVGSIAQWAAGRNGRLLTFSTDYVFDGTANTPYTESSPTGPINAYGRSKLIGERLALASGTLVVRTSWLISGSHRNFVSTILEAARGGPIRVVDDQVGSPTVTADLAKTSWAALSKGVTGLLHVTNQGLASRFDLARRALIEAEMDPQLVLPCSSQEYPAVAERPSYSAMDSERLEDLELPLPPHWEESLGSVVAQLLKRF